MTANTTIREIIFFIKHIPRLVFVDFKGGVWSFIKMVWARITGRPFTVELRQTGYRFKINSEADAWAIYEVVVNTEYHKAHDDLPEAPVIIDVGAHVGAFSIHFGRKYPGAQIYAYEPFPRSYGYLQENLSMNQVENVKTFPYAVGGETTMLMLDTNWIYPNLYSTTPYEDHANNGNHIAVQGISIDSIFNDNELSHCHLLKMDCEGAEFESLFSASPHILSQIDTIMMEYHDDRSPYTHQDMVSFLEEHNFHVMLEENNGIDDVGYIYASKIA